MNGLTTIIAILLMLLTAGSLIGLADRSRFSPRWLLVAALLVLVNDALLTRFYWSLPSLLPTLELNWEGKLLALAASLGIASMAAFGWRESGLTVRQAPGSLKAAVPVALAYCGFFVALALVFPNDALDHENLAFQLTLPGLEEELFYRGILLLALDRAFTVRARFLGVDWGWGALLSSLLFGLSHAFGYGAGGFSLDPMIMALTTLPSLIAVWVRLRTGSLLLPIIMHNFGNTIFHLI